MLRRIGLISTVVFVSTGSALAAQTVDRETVQALRQMAITAGQTSSAAIKSPAKDQKAIEEGRKALENHRAAFFARAYSGEAYGAVERKDAVGGTTPLSLSLAAKVPPTVDRETVDALRRLAIEAGQTSSSSAEPPTTSQAAMEGARGSIERHRIDFFARVYADGTGS